MVRHFRVYGSTTSPTNTLPHARKREKGDEKEEGNQKKVALSLKADDTIQQEIHATLETERGNNLA